ncbi:hypothetical protein TNCV_2466901 [Trichonephila clavipes]|nr:hypothetical protein TNCV_2466901 [Trichonephila clavipes]
MMMHDGAPVHFFAAVCDWLDMAYFDLLVWLLWTGFMATTIAKSHIVIFHPIVQSQGITESTRVITETVLVARLYAACILKDTVLL